MIRIYDAEFDTPNGNNHLHLHKFWWVDGSERGTCTREELYNYIIAHPKTVYVSEGGSSVLVYPRQLRANLAIKWVQTEADGLLKDNLVTLAQRHAMRLPNM